MKTSQKKTLSKTQLAEKIGRAMLEVGGKYRVSKYHTGDFIGECTRLGTHTAEFRILEPPRSARKGENPCPFAECSLDAEHDGEHDLGGLRIGSVVDIWMCHAQIERVHGILKNDKLEYKRVEWERSVPDDGKSGESRAEFERFGQSGGSRHA